ncbi:MAG TPA: hypothetical protein VGS21_03150, partial [Acidimicrobiales bacterium]|nr:hypothetical protein [Acidimicrobiales bacterium]
MKRGLGIYVALTCLICFGALFIAFAQSWTPKLGLDLAGGLSVDYQPVAGQTWNETSLQVAANIMGERASSRGLTNPNITVQGNTIQVQIPGITQPGQALGFLGNTSKLFFRPVLCAAPAYSKETVKGQLVDGPAFNGKTYVCPTVNKFTTAGYVAPQNGASSGGGYSASSFGSDASLAHVQTTSLVDDTYSATVLVPDPSGLYGPRLVLGPALAAGSIVKSAVAQVDPTSGGWVVVASLTGPGITQFDHAATVQYHMLLANDLGAEVNTAPVIEGTDYSNGQVQISGGFTESTANDLAQILNYGSIPIVLKEQQVQYVSATLGKASLQAGLLAGLVGLLLVMAYMIFYYRALGIVVVVGLVTTGALIYGLVCILGHTQNLTLDLAGVTGMIVSVGITV